MRHELVIEGDAVESADSIVGAAVIKPWPVFRVTASAGLFKQGKTHKKGAKIALHPDTAQRFIEAGEVEPT